LVVIFVLKSAGYGMFPEFLDEIGDYKSQVQAILFSCPDSIIQLISAER